MSIHRPAVGVLIATKAADILTTGYALTQASVPAHEGNRIAAEVMEAVGVWPAMLVLGTIAMLLIVGVCELAASWGYTRTRNVTYGVVILLWGVVVLNNLVVIL